jgi:hypothetical protein
MPEVIAKALFPTAVFRLMIAGRISLIQRGKTVPQKRQVSLFVGTFLLQEGHRRILGKRLNAAISMTKAPVTTGTGAEASSLS